MGGTRTGTTRCIRYAICDSYRLLQFSFIYQSNKIVPDAGAIANVIVQRL